MARQIYRDPARSLYLEWRKRFRRGPSDASPRAHAMSRQYRIARALLGGHAARTREVAALCRPELTGVRRRAPASVGAQRHGGTGGASWPRVASKVTSRVDDTLHVLWTPSPRSIQRHTCTR